MGQAKASDKRQPELSWIGEIKQELEHLDHYDVGTVVRALTDVVRDQVRRDPYGMLRNGLALGIGLRALTRDDVREGAFTVFSSMFSRILADPTRMNRDQ